MQTDSVSVARLLIAWEMTKQSFSYDSARAAEEMGERLRSEFQKNYEAVLAAHEKGTGPSISVGD